MKFKSLWRTVVVLGFAALSVGSAVGCGDEPRRQDAGDGDNGDQGDNAARDAGRAGDAASDGGGKGDASASGRPGDAGVVTKADAGSVPGSGDGGAITLPSGSCEPGSSETAWATDCQTELRASCTAGTWTDPGSTTNDPLQCESAHFAVHAPAGVITAQQCAAATDTLEKVIWPTYFGSPIFFPEPYCQSAKKYKASIVIHTDYGLTGGGWGQGYMGMWVGPGATADHWGLAHEFMHAVQSQTKGLACGGDQNYCGWIHESHANFMPHQLAEYRKDVHCSELLVNAPHLYLGSTRDRYCNWQFMEFLKDKYCYQAVNDIWTAAKTSNDPFSNIASTRGWSVSELNDFFAEWAMHNVTWDYQNPAPGLGSQGATYRGAYGAVTDTSKPERRLRTTRLEQVDADQNRYAVPVAQAPQRWGYNLVRLWPEPGASEVTVTFRGVVQAAASSDFRWGLVATDAALTTARYSPIQRGTDGALTFCVQAGEPLFLMVMGTPSVQQHIQWDALYPTLYRYPYLVQLAHAKPDGYQAGAPDPSAAGKRWSNGGGWVASAARVTEGAFVGPLASVLSGTVGAAARVEGQAVIAGGTLTSGTVGGLTILLSGVTVSGTARVELAWPYGPAWFEKPQSITGTAHMIGDLEYRGANATRSSGTYCGIVEDKDNDNCATADVTSAPPFVWRP